MRLRDCGGLDFQPLRTHIIKDMRTVSAFSLSRIQAEGWNAARRVPLPKLDGYDARKIDALNPYPADPERTRWRAGFESALEA